MSIEDLIDEHKKLISQISDNRQEQVYQKVLDMLMSASLNLSTSASSAGPAVSSSSPSSSSSNTNHRHTYALLNQQLDGMKSELHRLRSAERQQALCQRQLSSTLAQMSELKARNSQLEADLADSRAAHHVSELSADARAQELLAAERTVATVKAEYLEQLDSLRTENEILKQKLRQMMDSRDDSNDEDGKRSSNMGGNLQLLKNDTDQAPRTFTQQHSTAELIEKMHEVDQKWSQVNNYIAEYKKILE